MRETDISVNIEHFMSRKCEASFKIDIYGEKE